MTAVTAVVCRVWFLLMYTEPIGDKIVDESQFHSENSRSIDYWPKDVTGSVPLRLMGRNAAFGFHVEKTL